MKKMGLLTILLLTIFVLQCSKGAADEKKYVCQVDTDCKNSCALGAVNTQWYLKDFNTKNECLDGCDGPGTSPARCINTVCTAFSFGQYNPGCTKGPKLQEPLPLDLTKHSCAFDFDCDMSCSQGAVNRMWYKQSKWVNQDCMDGCAADGFSSKCEHHICEAYFEGKKYLGCTKK